MRGHFLKRVRPLTGHGAGRNAGKLPEGSHSRCGNGMLMCYGRLEGYCACLWLGGRRQSRAVVGRELAGACVRSLRRAAARSRLLGRPAARCFCNVCFVCFYRSALALSTHRSASLWIMSEVSNSHARAAATRSALAALVTLAIAAAVERSAERRR